MKIYREIAKIKTDTFLYVFEWEWSNQTLEYCRFLKQTYGWKAFAFFEKKWRFKDPYLISVIKTKYPQVEISDDIAKELQEKKKRELDFDIPGIKSLLRPYQKEAVLFLDSCGGRGIIADEMGTGKSLESLSYIVYKKMQKVLVICPASVKFAWENEVLKHTELKPYVISSKSKLDQKIFDKHNVFIINYDILKKYFDILKTFKFESIIIDECHYIKNTSALRTKATRKLAKNIPSIIPMSGTPIINRPIELFSTLQLMDQKIWNDWFGYAARYCGGHQGHWGYEANGATNLDELRDRIKKYFLRRTKDEILPDLPEKQFIDIPLELSTGDRMKYNLAVRELSEFLRVIRKMNKDEIDRSMRAETLVRLSALRMMTTMGKLENAKEVIDNIIDGGEKVLVFSCYNEPLEQYANIYGDKAVMITGKVSVEARGDLVKKFQEDDKVRVFLGGVGSAGVGITLTAASNVVFIDFPWTPAEMNQAIDRAHRMGATAEKLKIYKLYAKNTIDYYMVETLERKQRIFDKLIEGTDNKDDKNSIVNDLLNIIEKNENLTKD